ncbi:MAG: hypothetical protein D6800_14850, partial [Candidatus Zixiibacteriota bacterium]
LKLRTRGRYDVRRNLSTVDGSASEWKNRLWTLTLDYDNPHVPIGFSLGRFLPQELGSIGYLDGGLLRVRLNDRWQAAVLVGRRPTWAYNDNATMTLSRYGGYLSYHADISNPLYIDQSFGGVLEYQEQIPSRSFFTWQGSVRQGAAYGMHHSVDIDVNRYWRKAKAGHLFTLSNLYLQGWLRATPALRLSLQYDNRQNFWTYELLTTVDSLFDARVRQGVRARADYRVTRRVRVNGSLSYRRTAGDRAPTVSYTAGVNESGVFRRRVHTSLSIFGFDGVDQHGFGYTLRGQLPPTEYGSPFFSVRGYSYAVDGQPDSRKSLSIEVGSSKDFVGGYYLSGSAEASFGDDISGWRTTIEFGYRY